MADTDISDMPDIDISDMPDTDDINKMSDIENPDHFAEEIVESGVIRKTVKRSYIIQEVSTPTKFFFLFHLFFFYL